MRITADYLFNLPHEMKTDIWVLTDEVILNPGWNDRTSKWFIILAASPAKVQLSRQWAKQRKVGVHYMSPWKWEEIFAAFRYEMKSFLILQKPE